MSSKKGNANKSKGRTSANSTHQLVQADKKEDQIYAVVTKPLGNSTFLVEKQNGDEVMCSLKGSMKGKKFERVNKGDLVMVQEILGTSSQQKYCIMHLYNAKERKQLEKLGEFKSHEDVDATNETFVFEGDEPVIDNKTSEVDYESMICDI